MCITHSRHMSPNRVLHNARCIVYVCSAIHTSIDSLHHGDSMTPRCFGGNVTIRELLERCKCGSCSYFKKCKAKLSGGYP